MASPAVAVTLSILVAAPAAAAPPAVVGPVTFEPLPASAECGAEPLVAPFVLAPGYEQATIESQNSDPQFADLPDMNQLNETGPQAGRYLYRTHEVGSDGSISVTDLWTGETSTLVQDPGFNRLDGLKWAPWRTLLFAEETAGGLLFEIDPESGAWEARPALGAMAHEGIGLDPVGNVYVIDEFASGAIYRFVPDQRADLSSGQLSALRIVDEGSAPGAKTGTAEWVPLDRAAVQADARTAAAQAGATTYGRPEDVEVFDNVLYVAITSEDRVLAIDLKGASPFVTEFVAAGRNVPVEGDDAGDETDEVTGFDSPDNLAVDRAGNLFIAEDNTPGDLWVATPDLDRDGSADSVHLFASLSDCDAEPTGIYFGKDPALLYVNVQHAGGDGSDKAMVIARGG